MKEHTVTSPSPGCAIGAAVTAVSWSVPVDSTSSNSHLIEFPFHFFFNLVLVRRRRESGCAICIWKGDFANRRPYNPALRTWISLAINPAPSIGGEIAGGQSVIPPAARAFCTWSITITPQSHIAISHSQGGARCSVCKAYKFSCLAQ